MYAKMNNNKQNKKCGPKSKTTRSRNTASLKIDKQTIREFEAKYKNSMELAHKYLLSFKKTGNTTMSAFAITAATIDAHPKIFSEYWSIRENGLYPKGISHLFSLYMKTYYILKAATYAKEQELIEKDECIKSAYEHAKKEWIERMQKTEFEGDEFDKIADEGQKLRKAFFKECKKLNKAVERYEKSALKEKWDKNPIRRALTKFKNTVIKRENIGTVNQARWLYKLVTVEELEE
tara:strand:+ start:224 stop:928 length:705 start_codon:yes stop_codon:yes gene_type:complete